MTIDLRDLTVEQITVRLTHAVQDMIERRKGMVLGEAVGERPRYAVSADAVLPLLEEYFRWSAKMVGGYYTVSIEVNPTNWKVYFGEATTFPIAACIALLQAERLQTEPIEVLT